MPTVVQMLVQAFIGCQLNYCNSLLYEIADSQLRWLQSVQNAAAHPMTGTQRTEHITPVLQSLHWLLVRQLILFKLAVLVRKCLNGRAPAYLADDCRLIHCRQSGLRSSSSTTKLKIPPTRTMFSNRGTVYRRPFTTLNSHSLFSATDSSPIYLNSGCGVCDFEQTPSNVLTN